MDTTRRDFLKPLVTLAGTAAVSASPRASAGVGRTAASDGLVVGLIGCGGMGWQDLRDFLREPGITCAAVCDVDDERLQKRAADAEEASGKRPEVYKDYRRLLDRKDIDAVIIATPDHWHCLQLVHACEAGKDVYVEKPLANSIGECNVMLKAARRFDRVVQVGQQQRSGAHWAAAIDFVKSGKLGKVRSVKFWANFNYAAGRPPGPDEPVPTGVDFETWLGPAPARTFNKSRFHGVWRMFWDYGGGLQTDWGVHLIDMGLWALDLKTPPKSTVAAGGLFAHRGNVETFDTQTAIYRFDDVSLIWEHNAGIQSGPWGRNYGVAYLGTNGTLVADRSNWEVIPEKADAGPRMEAVPPQKGDEQDDHRKHVRDFIECVKTRKRPAADIEIGRLAALYAHLGNVAARTGRAVAWNESTAAFESDAEANALIRPTYRAPWTFPKA
jgi:predicted dehydrogenase